MWRRNGRSARRDSGARSMVVPSCGEKRIAPEVGGSARRMQRDDGGLAAAALADQRQRLAAADRKAHVLHRAHAAGLALQQPAADREFLGQAVDLEHGHARPPRARARHRVEAARAGLVGRTIRRRLDRAAAGDHLGTARMERAADRPRARMRHGAADRRQPLARHGAHDRAPSAAARACRDGAARRTAAATGANSTMRPRYITATSSAICAITPMSWVISISAMPLVRCSRRSRARICACVVTSSAVVGSSAIRMSGSAASASAMPTRWRRPPLSWNG